MIHAFTRSAGALLSDTVIVIENAEEELFSTQETALPFVRVTFLTRLHLLLFLSRQLVMSYGHCVTSVVFTDFVQQSLAV